MSTARLATRLWVNSLLRRAQALGVFATVLARGDADSGAVMLTVRHRNGQARLFTASTDAQGQRCWLPMADGAALPCEDVDARITRQRRYDTDLWVVELETDDATPLLD